MTTCQRLAIGWAISTVGVLSISDDVPAALARDTIESVSIKGVFRASTEVKNALADRMR